MKKIQTYAKNSRVRLSEHFTLSEFRCRGTGCCSTVLLDDQLVAYLQQIRTHFGKPVTINSGYRCPVHNAAIGGASNSYHCKGMAADISVRDTPPAEVAAYGEALGIGGIGLYETAEDGYFVHIDTRPDRSFWYGQRCAYRATFADDAHAQFLRELQTVMGIGDLAALADALPTISAAFNACHGVIAPTQKYLSALGYREVGPADGIAGPKFTAALMHFQQAHDCAPTGVAEQWGKTWHTLLGDRL